MDMQRATVWPMPMSKYICMCAIYVLKAKNTKGQIDEREKA